MKLLTVQLSTDEYPDASIEPISSYSSYSSWSVPSAVCREIYQPESLHELIDVDAPVLVEVNALGQVCDDLVADLCLEVSAQEFPCLTKLLKRDQT